MPPIRARRLTVSAPAAAAVLLAALLGPPTATADTGTPVIAEVYGGGGNSGATLRHDFVELGNATGAPVSVDGWSVQYLPASPKPTTGVQVTPLSGEIPAQGRYLVRQAAGAGGEADLPAPDAAGSADMSATAGTVLLVSDTTPVECRTAADCAADGAVIDVVGYGGAAVREGGSASGLSDTASAARGDGLADTGDNAADFTAGAPTPVNAAGAGPDGGPRLPGGPEEPGDLRIHDIQGITRTSPYAGDTVDAVPGVVTAVNAFGSAQGFWFQDPAGDGDPRTSEGLFAFTGSTAPGVAIGDEVLVSGRVDEYRPADGTQTITQVDRARWTVLSTGNPAPEPVDLRPGVIPEAYAPDHGGDITGLTLEPDTYALDFWAAHEHMTVRIEDAPVIAPTDAYSALWVTVEPGRRRTANGGVAYGSYADPNAGRVKVESLLDRGVHPFPRVDVGDTLAGVTEGPVYYSGFGGYLVRATTLGEHVPGGLERTPVRDSERYEVSIATYNVENLGGLDGRGEYEALAAGIVDYLDSPDIIGLEEIQDDNGTVDDGTVDAGVTLDRLVAAVEAQGGPSYQWRQINPEDKQDGGVPGGNIRNAFLFDPARVRFVDRPGGDATTSVEVLPGTRGAELSVSPGRIEPEHPAWDDSRKPLVGHFRALNRDIYVVTGHFASKGGDQPLHGVVQPPHRGSEAQRHAQAELVADFADDLLAVDPDANLVVMGDFNDFQFSRTLEILTGDGSLHNPMTDLPAEERYNYVFDGNSQALDHILVGRGIADRVDYEIARINSEFHDQVSDHDPQVLWLDTRRSTPPGRP